ncbi:hypothetical protein DICPUDRAFT_74129 [Dictyostelium purpureum]|uniref:Uncharacterized protein n=1 Tax=Dictyostelium purpureum TaxID=5786 RepID=F0Z6Q4_DICPU|nr:uncharacterized protein DICPUDRAFT_74129 [Dictyostelium purpureum]EGC40401.1 hypothetical protein DICPUDRAFT_74129 [Dictyostelium purpureum]|eukprot:XP_003283152.1 hypothetical protein DICPUDRAFT_74129 [Dictyostelium purpureum]
MEAIQQSNSKPEINVCTSGIGLSLVQKLLKDGKNRVVGTSRDAKKFIGLEGVYGNNNFFGLQVDLPNEESVKDSINKAVEKFGTITHVANCAGYGLVGCIEEISDKESRDMMDCIYFGPLNVIRHVLPLMRKNRFGYIFNVASSAGFKGFSLFGGYAGAKFALVGATEALAGDVKPFGINVACIILGYFKSGFQTNMSNDFGYAKNQIADYDSRNAWIKMTAPLFANRIPGDTNKFADLLVDHYSHQINLPYNLFIGPEDTFTTAEYKVKELTEQINSQKELNTKVLMDI